ncbi:hypothetical protein CHUAL_007373 [Chamberlinius hualienensis]
MARNKEKQYGKLNRLYLQQEQEVLQLRNPKRPRLSTLTTADEIKQWLPSIKRDIDFNLKQTEVICYSEDKVSELRNEVDRLENEYKQFIRKMKQLDSSIEDIPWTERPYKSKKRKATDYVDLESSLSKEQLAFIDTPILNRSANQPQPVLLNGEICNNLRIEGDDQPLVFNNPPTTSQYKKPIKEHKFNNEPAVQATESKLKKIFGIYNDD